jgi:hypothetical protein
MELSNITKKYWEEKDWADLDQSESVKDLYVIACRILERMPKNLSQVCGPISTGGKGNVEDNLLEFNKRIIELQEKGLNVFDQMPFEDPMHRMMLSFSKEEYMSNILTDFYLPLFEIGRISELYFLPDWKSSHGAKWEHEQAKRLGIKINYLN